MARFLFLLYLVAAVLVVCQEFGHLKAFQETTQAALKHEFNGDTTPDSENDVWLVNAIGPSNPATQTTLLSRSGYEDFGEDRVDFVPSWYPLERRVDPDPPPGPKPPIAWTKALCKGEQLMALNKEQIPAIPRYSKTEDFTTFGYRYRSKDVGKGFDDADDAAKAGLGLPTKGVSWREIAVSSFPESIVGSSFFQLTMTPTHNAISADSVFGPGKRVSLGRMSDIMFIAWQDQCETAKKPVGDLKYIFHNHIVNDETIDVLEWIQENRKLEKFPDWPGIEFDTSTDEGKALLGTPNGSAQGWLLVDRQDTFPGKTIKSVTAFNDKNNDIGLVFRIDDLPKPPENPPVPPQGQPPNPPQEGQPPARL